MAKDKKRAPGGGYLTRQEKLRRKQARIKRLPDVVSHYLRGASLSQIADMHGLTYDQIREDIRYARRLWAKKAQRAAESYLSEELAKVNLTESQAWKGWEASCKDMVEHAIEKGGDKGDIRKRKKRGQAGDARFLAIVLECIDKRCKMLKIGEYSTEEGLKAQTRAIEIVVETAEQANRILNYEEYEKILPPNN